MKNTLNPCGCDGGGGTIVITTSNVNYNGPATLCIPMNPGDSLTTILERIDQKICDFVDDLSDYYTKEEIDTILGDYAKSVDLLSSGEVDGSDLVFNNAAGEVFRIDASAFLAQGVTLTFVNGTLSLLDADGNVLSSVNFTADVIKTAIPTTTNFSINWQTDTVPADTRTYAQKHGNDFTFQGYYESGGFELSYFPSCRITRSGGNITLVEFADINAGRLIII